MITYKLRIAAIDRINKDGVKDWVSRAHWVYVGTDEDGDTATFGGAVEFPFDADSPFTPFTEVTEEQIASWVLATWPDAVKQQHEGYISTQLAAKVGIPWQAVVVTPIRLPEEPQADPVIPDGVIFNEPDPANP